MEVVNQLFSEMSSVSRQALAVSEQLEMAQASRPFTEKLESFANIHVQQSIPFTLALATSDDTRIAALAWVAGPVAAELVAGLSGTVDRIIFDLTGNGGISVAVGAAQPRSFDTTEQCLEAMKGHAGGRQMRISLPPPAGRLEGAVQFIHLPAVIERPGLVGSLISESCLLAAISGNSSWNQEEQEALAELASGIGAILPVKMGTEAAVFPRCAITFPLENPSDEPAPLPTCLAPGTALRQGLISCRESRRLKLLVEALSSQYEREVRQANALKVKEERNARSLEDAGRSRDYRGEIDRIRTFFADDLKRVIDQLGETNRNATLPQGAITLGLRKMVDAVAPNDIVFEEGPSNLILRLHQQALDILSSACGDLLRDQLRADIFLLRTSLKETEEQVSQMIMQFSGIPIALNLTLPEEGDLWRKMTEMICLEIRYRGEMPKRNFFNRISEGRRPVFMILMVGSIVGSAFGFNMRARPLMLVFLAMFIAGFLYTFFSWKREDRARLEKELERVRESLITEIKRLVAEVQREKLSRILAHLDEVRRDIDRRLDSYLRDVQKAETDRNSDERREGRSRQRTQDQRQRELAGQATTLSRLLQSCAEIERKCIQATSQITVTPT